MNTKLKAIGVLLAGLLAAGSAQAHIVGIGWTFGTGGDISFNALTWHGDASSARGALIVDGTSYNFTSFRNNASMMTGLDGGLANSAYSTYSAGVLTALGTPGNAGPVNDWLNVTVSGAAHVPGAHTGAHTLSAAYGPGGLTSWTLNGGVTSVGIIAPPPPPVIPPTAVPEPSSLALLGLGLAGFVAVRRRKKA